MKHATAEAEFVIPGNQFASDNTPGLCPRALERLVQANNGFENSYGEDQYTLAASDAIRRYFDCPHCEVFFVFNGTAANALALASLCQSYHSVIAHESAHIETDECGAPEFFSNGTKLLLASGEHGKLTPGQVEWLIKKRSDIHYPRPNALSLTQATELGTIYSLDEIRQLTSMAREHGLKTHMDGARFGRALATLGCHPKEVTWKSGIDVLCLGFIKSGFSIGDAVVFFKPELAEEFDYRCKQAGQLASKMRFISAPTLSTFEDNLYLRHAEHANACARRLASAIQSLPGVTTLYPVEANAVFVNMPNAVQQHVRKKGWKFYTFLGGGARFMSSWATTFSEVDALAADMATAATQFAQ